MPWQIQQADTAGGSSIRGEGDRPTPLDPPAPSSPPLPRARILSLSTLLSLHSFPRPRTHPLLARRKRERPHGPIGPSSRMAPTSRYAMAAVAFGLLLLGALRLGRANSLSSQLMQYVSTRSDIPLLDDEDPFDERIRRLELQLGLPRALGAASHDGVVPRLASHLDPSPPSPSPTSYTGGTPSTSPWDPRASASMRVWDNSRVLSSSEVLRRVPSGALAFVALANTAYADLAVNWALVLLPILETIGVPHHAVLASLDNPSAQRFVRLRLPTMRVGMGGINNTKDDNTDFRWAMSAFRAYGVSKAEVIMWLLREGRDVCMSDVDAAWIAPPHGMFRSLPEADVLFGTDCLNLEWDADRSTRPNKVGRCGHHPGSTWSAWFNTGVMFFRANPRALEIASEWRDRMAAVRGEGSIDDQLTFNQLAGTVRDPVKNNKEGIYPIKAARTDGRVIYDGTGHRTLAALPADVICSAQAYHIFQSSEPKNCLVLHLTFVEGWPKNPAKYWRLREAGLFPLRPEPFDGRYLSFTPPQPGQVPPERHPSLLDPNNPNVRRPLPNLTPDKKGWKVKDALWGSPRMAAHFDLVDRHIAALRNAMAIARATRRRLIMPKMLCLCERSESPFSLLPTCTLAGSSTKLPFVCPLESIFDVVRVEHLWAKTSADPDGYLQLHPWTLLNASIHKPPQPSLAFQPSRTTTVSWSTTGWVRPPASHGTNGVYHQGNQQLPQRVVLPRGLSDVQISEALAEWGASDARLLHLESAEDVFGGFEAADAAKTFEKNIATHLLGGWSATWCCTSWDKPRGTLLFKRPLPLAVGKAAKTTAWMSDGTPCKDFTCTAPRPHEIPMERQCYAAACRD